MGYFKTLFVEALDGFVEHESTPSAKEMLAVALDGGMDTLEEHDKKYHPEGYKEGDECKYREKEKEKDKVDEISEGTGASKKIGDGSKLSPFVQFAGKPMLFKVGLKPDNRLGWTKGWGEADGETKRTIRGKDTGWAYLALNNPLNLMEGFREDEYGEEADENEVFDYKVRRFCDLMEKGGAKINRKLIMANLCNVENPNIDNMIEEVGEESFERALKNLGYDGFVWDYDEGRVTAFDREKVLVQGGEGEEGLEAKKEERGNKEGQAISKIYTGSGRTFEKPSLQYVGSAGAGTYASSGGQLGYGVYGTTIRKRAERYAAVQKEKNKDGKEQILEQTFFTDGSKVVSPDSVCEREDYLNIRGELEKEGFEITEDSWTKSDGEKVTEVSLTKGGKKSSLGYLSGAGNKGLSYKSIYDGISNATSPKEASRIFSEAGIGGFKKEVSYRETNEDGDETLVEHGFDFVSFRDDNIEVNKRWVDGKEQEGKAKNTGGDGDKPLVSAAEDAAYMEAVEKGDMQTAQRMVREAAARAMPDTQVKDKDGLPRIMYHGTQWSGDGAFYEGGVYFTTRDLAEEFIEGDDEAHVLPIFVDMRKPYYAGDGMLKEDGTPYKAKGGYREAGPDDATWGEDIEKDLRRRGYDGIIDNIFEEEITDDSIFNKIFESGRVKSAAPVTHYDDGSVVPLSKRFGGGKDIRFAVEKEDSTQTSQDGMTVQDELIEALAWALDGEEDMTLKEHDKRHHPEGFNPETDTCKFRERLQKKHDVDTLEVGETERTPLVTAEEDAAYMEAVKRGDMETAAKMVREVAGRAFPNTKVVDDDGKPRIVFHGSSSPTEVTEFDTANENHGGKTDFTGAWFTPTKSIAQSFADNTNPLGEHGEVYSVYLNIENPFVFNAQYRPWNKLKLGESIREEKIRVTIKYPSPLSRKGVKGAKPHFFREDFPAGTSDEEIINSFTEWLRNLYGKDSQLIRRLGGYEDYDDYENQVLRMLKGGDDSQTYVKTELYARNKSTQTTDELAREIRKKGESDGVIIENVKDGGGVLSEENDFETADPYYGYEDDFHEWGITDIIVFDGRKIKSADPVTYDDNGNVIPLSRRFDDGDDIRGDVTSKQEGDDMENKEAKESQGETHETALEKMVEGMGINVYRPAIAETLKEMAGEVPDAVITSTEEFDREVKGMKEGKRTYMDVRNAYAKLKDACGDLDWTKFIVKMAAKITKACAKQDIEEDVK